MTKNCNILQLKKIFFWMKKYNFLSPGLHEGRLSFRRTGEVFSPQNRTSCNWNMHILHFFLLFVANICPSRSIQIQPTKIDADLSVSGLKTLYLRQIISFYERNFCQQDLCRLHPWIRAWLQRAVQPLQGTALRRAQLYETCWRKGETTRIFYLLNVLDWKWKRNSCYS